MSTDYQFAGVDEGELEESDKVFGPSGFGVVVNASESQAMIAPIRENEHGTVVHDLDDIEAIDEREWIVYEEGVVETPHR